MKLEMAQACYLDEQGSLTLAELTELSGLSEAELHELVDCGALEPNEPASREWTFGSYCLVVARTAHRLREEFALEDTHALAVVLRLSRRIEMLEGELRSVRRRMR